MTRPSANYHVPVRIVSTRTIAVHANSPEGAAQAARTILDTWRNVDEFEVQEDGVKYIGVGKAPT